ncbi:hypothetical protein [Orrella marina]|uniref:Uncharacterized protein n=1 Tax=Orrella marina TaxID=2163011 RepID=A0A2R4XKE8_9BURK|nr:hypothetical protein [Orrella marina]AWB34292.1 hypothetical protein DBV39_11925 [Orrella marina]
MFEELDHLENRIRTVVERTQTLDQACEEFRRQVESLKAERDSLLAQVNENEVELVRLRANAGHAESTVQAEKRRAQEQVSQLQGTLDLFVAEKDAIKADLKSREQDVVRLKAVTREAQARIDGVLERLPGALVQGQE